MKEIGSKGRTIFPAFPSLPDILHTWECPVFSVDPSVQPTAASFLSLLGDCRLGQALSDGRGWRSKLMPDKYSLPLWSDSVTDCRQKKQNSYSENTLLNICFCFSFSSNTMTLMYSINSVQINYLKQQLIKTMVSSCEASSRLHNITENTWTIWIFP